MIYTMKNYFWEESQLYVTFSSLKTNLDANANANELQISRISLLLPWFTLWFNWKDELNPDCIFVRVYASTTDSAFLITENYVKFGKLMWTKFHSGKVQVGSVLIVYGLILMSSSCQFLTIMRFRYRINVAAYLHSVRL